jgi:hypothetical protein
MTRGRRGPDPLQPSWNRAGHLTMTPPHNRWASRLDGSGRLEAHNNCVEIDDVTRP